jgi:hypothetical protein
MLLSKLIKIIIKMNIMKAEFWKLKRLDRLYQIYPEIEHCPPSFLELHKALNKRGLNPNNMKWFADAIETGAIGIPEIQKKSSMPK